MHLEPFMDIIEVLCVSGRASRRQGTHHEPLEVMVVADLASTVVMRRSTPMPQGTWRIYSPMQPADGDDRWASLQIVCAWCQQPLGWHQGQTPTRFPISYSICARCYRDVTREIKASPMS